jgi:triacylglycerol lipase
MTSIHENDTVVLLHGLARTPRSMLGAGLWFQRAGFEVAYVGYPSRKMGIEQAVHEHVAPQLQKIATRPGMGRVHFITHSLGGIVFRAWAAVYAESFPLGRAVLLAPPNQGSEIVDKLGGWNVAQKIMGPVLQELGTGENSTPRRLGAVPAETAVIMGDQANLPFFRQWLGPDSDGVVPVEGGRAEGLADFLVLPAGHTWIMWRPAVLTAAEHFIRHGHFARD